MEVIKKQMELITTTATTTCDGDIEGPCYEVIVDESVNYSLKLMLTARDIDFGFFDVLYQSPYYGYGYGYEELLLGLGEDLL